MDDLKRARTELRRAAYEDRAIKNLKDGYNFDESRKFSEVLLNGLNGSEEWEKIFRTRIDLLSMHAMMLRSETMRYAELPDLCSLRIDNEGPAVIQQITRGKTVRREDAVITGRLIITDTCGIATFWLAPLALSLSGSCTAGIWQARRRQTSGTELRGTGRS